MITVKKDSSIQPTTLRTIIVDDEQSAQDVLENLLDRYCPSVQLLDKCSNVEEAVASIEKNQPDIVFLDIEMPNYAGYELVSFFETVNFDIIFITAYDHYAIKAFEVSAVDYLLKPVDIERLKSAVDKVQEKKDRKIATEQYQILKQNLETNTVQNIIVPFQNGQKVIKSRDIIALEAQESYTNIYTISSGVIMVSKNLRHFEKIFENDPHFFRTHKSWIIIMDQMEHFSKSKSEIKMKGGITAKLSKYRKTEFETLLQTNY